MGAALLNASPFLFSLVQCDVTGEEEEQPGVVVVDAFAATSKRGETLSSGPFGGRRGEGGMFVWSVAPLMDADKGPCSDD